MIDFPASPTDGQIFSAANGVVYKYSAAYTSWLAQNPTPAVGGTGDFAASGAPSITATAAVMVVPAINGNAGGWFSGAGRYTPPAGRYSLFACLSAWYNSGATGITGSWRKNGTAIFTNSVNSPGANLWGQLIAATDADANGSDYFEFWAAGNPGPNGATCQLSAFPLTGMQGPTGGAPGPVVGDFYAISTAIGGINSSAMSTVIFPTVVTGNSGAYYNVANGRYTPPAGRYRLSTAGSWYSAAGAAQVQVVIRKNGTNVAPSLTGSSSAANFSADATYEALVDANGTDWFDVQMACGGNGITAVNLLWFTAFPTQGMVGPQGPAGPPGVTPDIPQNSQSGAYTLVLTDAGKHIYHPVGAGGSTYTIPDNSSVAFNIGAAVTFVNDSANAVTINTVTDTLVLSPGNTTGARTLAVAGMATALKVAATRWMISGVGLT